MASMTRIFGSKKSSGVKDEAALCLTVQRHEADIATKRREEEGWRRKAIEFHGYGDQAKARECMIKSLRSKKDADTHEREIERLRMIHERKTTVKRRKDIVDSLSDAKTLLDKHTIDDRKTRDLLDKIDDVLDDDDDGAGGGLAEEMFFQTKREEAENEYLDSLITDAVDESVDAQNMALIAKLPSTTQSGPQAKSTKQKERKRRVNI